MILKFNWLILFEIYLNILSSNSAIFHVAQFGAYPNDNIDDSRAIQLAVNRAIRSELNSTVVFGAGIYNLSSAINITNAINLTITGQGMSETLLVGNNPIFIFTAEYCQGITIRSFSIDFDPLPFTAGYVVNVNNTYIDIRVVSPHRTDVNRKVVSIFRYDPMEQRPAFGVKAYQIFQSPPNNVSTTIVESGVLRLPIERRYEFVEGDPIVALFDLPANALSIKYSSDVFIESITVHASWMMGLLTFRATRLTVLDYHAAPGQGRWLSTNSDCMHFTDAREYINLSNSKCHLTGDDGCNIHKVYLQAAEVINTTALVLKAIGWIEPVRIGEGIRLEFKVHRMQNYSAELILLIHTCLDAVFNADHEYHLHFLCSVSFHVSKRLAMRGCHNAPFMLPKKTQGNIGFLCFNTSFLSKTHTISRFYVKN